MKMSRIVDVSEVDSSEIDFGAQRVKTNTMNEKRPATPDTPLFKSRSRLSVQFND